MGRDRDTTVINESGVYALVFGSKLPTAKEFKHYTAQALADLLGISKVTWTNRMKEPWKQFGLDDFRLISKYCRVDFVELVNGRLRLKGE